MDAIWNLSCFKRDLLSDHAHILLDDSIYAKEIRTKRDFAAVLSLVNVESQER
jgi:hypothetical protein